MTQAKRHNIVFFLSLNAVLGAMFSLSALASDDGAAAQKDLIQLRASGVIENSGGDPARIADLQVLAAFQKKFPNVVPVSLTGLEIPGKTMDIVPLMQIAGDIPPDVMYVNLRQSATYIANKFLYPLDKYVEKAVGVAEVKDGHLLPTDQYVEHLKKGPNYAIETNDRVTPQCWEIMRRKCPYGLDCPHCKEWKATAAQTHWHIWFFPNTPEVNTLFFRKDLLYEAGLPTRAPKTMEEMLDWCRQLTNPKDDRYGLSMYLDELGWSTLGFLYSEGGRLVEQDEQGHWRCCFDTEAAVEAYYFVARLFHEPYDNKFGHMTSGVVFTGQEPGGTTKVGMQFDYLSSVEFSRKDSTLWAFGPLPAGKKGDSAGEFNASMQGIYAGLEHKVPKRDAAWEYIHYYNGPEARLIRTRVYVENGQAQYVHPQSLRDAGYPEFIAQIPQGWEEEYRKTVENGVPEPYGENTQQVYRYASKAIDQIRTDNRIIDAIHNFDATTARTLIREILKDRVKYANEKMLNILAPEDRAFRNNVAMAVAIFILVIFTVVFWKIFKTFAQKGDTAPALGSRLRAHQHRWAYIWLFPAIGSIALWEYYPLARGTVMAFQNYNVRGFSDWVGLANFASVLFDQEFWYAIWVSLKYGMLTMLFGFCSPILLAFLLSEVPRGKTLFRTIYYLPAVLSGVIVMLLWRNFYAPEGLLNQVLNLFVHLFNHIPGVHLTEQHSAWLSDPNYALICCLLPSIWAGMGPGCLIYLAALKTIPDELYEAADIDGAGIFKKVFYVALPSIRALIVINFIGAVIGVMKSGGQIMLVMTGGGPYTPNGQTEVIGLHIWWEAFGFLRFGAATAMAWILGSMLIGFTVIQLQRLKNMEFKTAEKV
jgi:ABC-type sugar transport system permease subunit/ABC-type glycerol-3-phosphate transport system substrate-binding protein